MAKRPPHGRKGNATTQRPSSERPSCPAAHVPDPGSEVVALPEWFTYNFASAGPQGRMAAGSLPEDGNCRGHHG